MKTGTKVIIVLSILVLAYYNHMIIDGKEFGEQPKDSGVAETTDSSESSGKALIGGEFELTDQNGEKFGSNDLEGKTSLIYFGFTHCPMICPTALSTITLVMDEIDPEAENYRPVFITTDPERDSVERMSEYLESFHPATVGLTGTKEQLEEAYKGYKVYAKKVDTGTENYDMNHSSIIYVMDENGEYVAHFNHESKVEDIVAKLNSL